MKRKYLQFLFILFFAFSTFAWVSCGMLSNDDDNNIEISDDEDDDDNEREDSKDNDLFVSKDGQFKINFPESPEITSDIVPTDAGDIELYSFLYEKSATEAYMVAYGDYPSALVDEDDPYSMLISARGGALEDMEALIEDEKEFEINKFPALRTYAISQTDNYYIVYEAALANNRLYQIMMVRDGTYSSEENVESFMDSFVITMKK